MQTRDKGGGEDCNDVCTDEIDVDEGAVNCDVGVAAATGGEVAEPSVGVSKPDGEDETKLSFFFRNSSLHLAFLLIVEGLGFFLLGAVCPRPAQCHLSQRRKKSPKPK